RAQSGRIDRRRNGFRRIVSVHVALAALVSDGREFSLEANLGTDAADRCWNSLWHRWNFSPEPDRMGVSSDRNFFHVQRSDRSVGGSLLSQTPGENNSGP